MNIQDEVQKIHHQYGVSEKANYLIQLLFDEQKEKSMKFVNWLMAICELSEDKGVWIYEGEEISNKELFKIFESET